MWFLGSIMMSSASLFYMQFQWFPTYLKETFLNNAGGESERNAGWLTSFMMVGPACGCLLGGVAVDALAKRGTNRTWSRRLVGASALSLAALSMMAVPYAGSAAIATLCSTSAGFCSQFAVPTWWTVVSEISGKHGAAMWGLMNSMGGVGVIVSTFLIGRSLTQSEHLGYLPLDRWGPVFSGVGLFLVTGAILWLLVDPTRSIVQRTARGR
jgi:MFS family permease